MSDTEAVWSASPVDAAAMFGLGAYFRNLLTDPDHLVGVPVTPVVHQDSTFRFGGALDTARATVWSEFCELVNRVPTQPPVWTPPATTHLWDVYGEILGADLARSTLTPEEHQRYDTAVAYLYDTGPDGVFVPSPALREYRTARQAWLQADTDYHQAEQAAAMSADAAARDHWTHVDEPRLRQARDDAMDAWQTAGHKAEVEDALRETSELASKAPSGIWKRHRDTFNPNLPDQYTTAPNGTRFAPTYYSPDGALDDPWSRVVLSEPMFRTLAAQAPAELRATFGDRATDDSVFSLAFEYRVVSVVRPWLDPPMELFGSRAWRLSAGVAPLSDGATPPHGRCPSYVESVALARNIELIRRAVGYTETPGETTLRGTWTLDLDNGVAGGDMTTADLWWEWTTQTSAQLVPGSRAGLVNLGPVDYDAFDGPRLAALTYATTPLDGSPDAGNQLADGDVFAVRTTEGRFAKVLVVQYGYDLHLRWVAYQEATSAVQDTTTAPEDVFLAGFVCRQLPKSPDPDPALTW
ncbi:hypothetical protein ACIRU8_10100 [Streptomyces sp. NPDC101175]|uniref:hypothetical protein n=1 Tax=Streptomyces sp. NPDC101175 TaxID=3366123 RepID=UPI003837C855